MEASTRSALRASPVLRSRANPSRSSRSSRVEPVQVGDVADELGRVQLLHEPLADAVDVHGALAHEVLDALDELRRTGAVRAAHGHLSALADRAGAASGALGRHGPLGQGRVAGGAFHAPPVLLDAAARGRPHDLRDHVAGPLDDDVVARADVLAADVVLVVQRRPLHGDAADEDRLEHGERA